MAAVCILEDRATVVEYVPPARPTSATCSFKDSSGSELSAPAVTVDATNLTIASATSSTVGVLTSSALTPDRSYWHVSANRTGQESLVRCAGATVSDHGFTLEAPPSGNLLEASDTIKGARLTATISAAAAATRGLNYRCEWTVTCADGVVRVYQQPIHVVRCLFEPACTPDAASRYVSNAFPSMGVDRPWGYFVEVARRASARVERKLLGGGRYQHLVGDSQAFVDAGLVALRIELGQEGLVPAGYDVTEYMRRAEQDLSAAVADAVAGLWYDADDSGAVDSAGSETRGLYSMRLVRR